MEQGSLRCDANVSLRPRAGEGQSQDDVPLGTRTETKNVNSLRSVERAVRYEICRHAAILDGGGSITQETRHWHEDTGVTTSGREKSDAEDYRYFPEPDLVPVAPTRETVEALKTTLPEPPAQRRKRLQADWGFSDLEMRDVVNAGAVELIEESVEAGATPAGARKWWTGELARRGNAAGKGVDEFGVTPLDVAELDRMVRDGRLNDNMARQVLDGVIAGEGSPLEVADARGPSWCRTTTPSRRPSTRSSRRIPMWQKRCAAARCRPPERSSAGHEGDEGPGRRRQGAPNHPGAPRRQLTGAPRPARLYMPRGPAPGWPHLSVPAHRHTSGGL